VLADKLVRLFNLDLNLVGWIVNFLSNRTWCVRANGFLSSTLCSSTGSPHWSVLSPLLFILYTNDYRSTFGKREMLKFADDTVIVSLLANSWTCGGGLCLLVCKL
jgi:hypothetical protein